MSDPKNKHQQNKKNNQEEPLTSSQNMENQQNPKGSRGNCPSK